MLPRRRRNRILCLLIHPVHTGPFHRKVRLLRVIARHDESNDRDAIPGPPVLDQGMRRAGVVSIMLSFVGKLVGVFEGSVDTVNLVPDLKDLVDRFLTRGDLNMEKELKISLRFSVWPEGVERRSSLLDEECAGMIKSSYPSSRGVSPA